MELFFSDIAHILIASGTMGTWAFMSILLIVYGWFKYIKPYLKDWKDIRSTIVDTQTAYSKIIKMLDKIIDSVADFDKDSNIRHNSLKTDMREQDKLVMKQIEDDYVTLSEKIKDLQIILDKHSDIDINKLNELMIELTKINLRLEMTNSIGNLRGMK